MTDTQLSLFELAELTEEAAAPVEDLVVAVAVEAPVGVVVVEPATAGAAAPAVDPAADAPMVFAGADGAGALPAWAERLVVFDLETTGIDVETSRIVTANISWLDARGLVVHRRDWLADPGVDIPEQATAVHGVTTERARAEGRPAVEVVGEIVGELRRALGAENALVVYNAPYDLTLLAREAVRHGIPPLVAPAPVIDPLVIDKQIDRFRKGKRTLEVSAAFYGVELTDAHDAGADAIAAGLMAQALGIRYASELDLSAHDLHRAQVEWHEAQCDSFEDYMRRVRDPSFTARRGWPEAARPA